MVKEFDAAKHKRLWLLGHCTVLGRDWWCSQMASYFFLFPRTYMGTRAGSWSM